MQFSYRMVPEIYQLFGRRWRVVSSSPMPLWRPARIAG
jgi:hypothetical protein